VDSTRTSSASLALVSACSVNSVRFSSRGATPR
jgi:hypothetical protein